MVRTMYDSVTPSAIPRDAAMVAGYLAPSRYAWSAADWALFPRAVKVRVAIFASVNDGHVLDVEPGDATPAEAPGWVLMRRAAGLAEPTVYCNASTWPQVRAEFRRQQVREPQYWIAKYDNAPTIPAGAVAKQYANPPVHGRGHFDLSIVADVWPGVDTGPKEDDMTPEQAKQLDYTQRIAVENQRRIGLVRTDIAALTKVVAADKDIDPAELARLVDAAVAEHTPTAEENAAALLPLVEDVTERVLGADNKDLAAEVLRQLREALPAT